MAKKNNLPATWQMYNKIEETSSYFDKTSFTSRKPFVDHLSGLSSISKSVVFNVLLEMKGRANNLPNDESLINRFIVKIKWKNRNQKSRSQKELVDIAFMMPLSKDKYVINIKYINPLTFNQTKEYLNIISRAGSNYYFSKLGSKS